MGDGQKPTITRALRVEIVKPFTRAWDEVGPALRTIRGIVHRLYTAAALAAIETDKQNRKGNSKVALHPQTAAYRAVEEELEDIREWASKKRKGEDREYLKALAELRIPGGMKAAISAAAFTGFQKWRKNKGRERVPTWKHGAPIPVRAQESGLRMEGGAAILTVKLEPKGRHDFVVRAGKGSHWGRLRALATGTESLKLGETKIVYNVRQKKWFAFIAYSEPAPSMPQGLRTDHVMVLHRGQRNLLVAATNEGKYKVLASGNKLREFKRGIQARRRSFQNVAQGERGRGSRGHGRRRRYDMAEHLSEKEASYVKTLCQQLGARVVQLAKAWGCGRILIEDYGGIEPSEERGKRMYLERFPNAELKAAVGWSLRKAGIELGVYEHAYMSQTCPRCDNVDDAQHNMRTGVFHCRHCQFERNVDVIGAIHAVRRACDGDGGVWDTRLEVEQKLAASLLKQGTG